MVRLFIFIVLMFLSNATVNAQQCDTSRSASTPEDNFFINDDGSITELETGLTWQRCALGQLWYRGKCEGKAVRISWKQSLSITYQHNENNWRLPSLIELATIVERKCKHPKINTRIFPNTPKGKFWTSTTRKESNNESYAIDFDGKGIRIEQQDSRFYVRLVSGRE